MKPYSDPVPGSGTVDAPGIRMCDFSFRIATGETGDGPRRRRGTCNLCHQLVGAVVVGSGKLRINWHERAPIQGF